MAQPINVLLEGAPLVDARSQAGIGRYVASLAHALHARDDVAVRVATPARGPWRESAPLRWLNSQPSLLVEGRFRPDIVHATASEPAFVSTPARQVVTVHDVVPWTAPAGGRLRATYLAYQRRRLRRCGAVIAVGASVAEEAIAALGLEPSRVHVVPEGVDPVFTPIPEADVALRRDVRVHSEGYVLWVGSMRAHDPRKALDFLVDAIAAIDGARLVLAGAGGLEADRVAARATELRVDTTITGYVNDQVLAALYRGAGAVALPSHHEGFGLPMLEAMACGAPVVATATGNLPALAGDAAALVPPEDAAAFSSTLQTILADPAAAARHRKLGPRVAAPYTWGRAAHMTTDVYRLVLAGTA
ncbi:MAG: hypothetical protein QOE92_2210 [Chloroflexota bacterium]|nr:hypothetical protein [Chloroflexota bacterium]